MTSALHRLRRAYRTARNARDDVHRQARLAAARRGYLITDVDALLDSGEPPIGDGYLFVPNVHAVRG